jgi:hypothetical protein
MLLRSAVGTRARGKAAGSSSSDVHNGGFLGRCEADLPTAGMQMGEVLGESARIALSWIRAHASQLPLLPAGDSSAEAAAGSTGSATNPNSTTGSAKANAADSTSWDVHLHLPAGAVPKVTCKRQPAGPTPHKCTQRKREVT